MSRSRAGAINTIVTVPVTLAYVAIMFPHAAFRPYINTLSRLVFLGSALHQLTFTLRSSLPFAVGQVQDVGLIFLSAMSTSVVVALDAAAERRGDGGVRDDRVMLATTLLAMTLSTTFVGGLLCLVGKCALGRASVGSAHSVPRIAENRPTRSLLAPQRCSAPISVAASSPVRSCVVGDCTCCCEVRNTSNQGTMRLRQLVATARRRRMANLIAYIPLPVVAGALLFRRGSARATPRIPALRRCSPLCAANVSPP